MAINSRKEAEKAAAAAAAERAEVDDSSIIDLAAHFSGIKISSQGFSREVSDERLDDLDKKSGAWGASRSLEEQEEIEQREVERSNIRAQTRKELAIERRLEAERLEEERLEAVMERRRRDAEAEEKEAAAIAFILKEKEAEEKVADTAEGSSLLESIGRLKDLIIKYTIPLLFGAVYLIYKYLTVEKKKDLKLQL